MDFYKKELIINIIIVVKKYGQICLFFDFFRDRGKANEGFIT